MCAGSGAAAAGVAPSELAATGITGRLCSGATFGRVSAPGWMILGTTYFGATGAGKAASPWVDLSSGLAGAFLDAKERSAAGSASTAFLPRGQGFAVADKGLDGTPGLSGGKCSAEADKDLAGTAGLPGGQGSAAADNGLAGRTSHSARFPS